MSEQLQLLFVVWCALFYPCLVPQNPLPLVNSLDPLVRQHGQYYYETFAGDVINHTDDGQVDRQKKRGEDAVADPEQIELRCLLYGIWQTNEREGRAVRDRHIEWQAQWRNFLVDQEREKVWRLDSWFAEEWRLRHEQAVEAHT